MSDMQRVSQVPVREWSSVLLLSAHEARYFQLPFVRPFKNQLRCYARQRGMRFAADGGPWPLQHVTLGRTSSYFWVGRWATGARRLEEVGGFLSFWLPFFLTFTKGLSALLGA